MDRARAGPWLEEKLTDRLEDTTTVVFHSVVLQYLDADERLRVFERLHEAGRRATDGEPVAWLRFEAGDWRRTSSHEVRLTLWPGGEDRKLAESGPHGRPVRWLGYSA